MTNAGAAGPWPARSAFGPRGLMLGGIPAVDIADRFGTPVLVMDEDEIRERARLSVKAFPVASYAVKAFTSHAMVRLALEEGLGIICSTGGELEACLRAGAPADRLVLHGSNKSDEELELAVAVGVRHLIADGIDELRRLDVIARRAGRVQDVLLRVLPAVETDTHEAIATGHEESKFGTPSSRVVDVLREASGMSGLRVIGIQAHIGSQLFDQEPYLQELDVLVDLAARLSRDAGVGIEVLDIGGGFGVAYTDEEPLDVESLAATLMRELDRRCADAGIPVPTLEAEPGRYLVANAGVTLYTVGNIKQAGGKTLLAVDGGMADNIRPMLYDAAYSMAVAATGDGRDITNQEPKTTVTVVGRHCESGDTLAEDIELPASVRAGDVLAVASTGAYAYPLASNYNRAGKIPVVAISNGVAKIWLRREDASDMDRLEMPSVGSPSIPTLPLEVTVRPARASDARSYIPFWSRIVAEPGTVRNESVTQGASWYRKRFRRPVTDTYANIVAVVGDEVVGHIHITRDEHPVTRHVASLGIAVARDFRRQGIGAALMAEGMAWARSVGVEKVVLSVYPTNRGAIALYRKFGFVDEGRLTGQSRKSEGYVDEILMGAWIDDRRATESAVSPASRGN